MNDLKGIWLTVFVPELQWFELSSLEANIVAPFTGFPHETLGARRQRTA